MVVSDEKKSTVNPWAGGKPPPRLAGTNTGVFADHLDYVHHSLMRLGVPASEVEDLTHEVFLVFHRRRDTLDCKLPLRPWLFGVAYRISLAAARRRRREMPTSEGEIEALASVPSTASDASDSRALVQRALERLPLPARAVLVMHEIDGVPMREVARAMSIPLFTAYSRMRVAKRGFEAAVRELLEGGTP